MTQPYGNLKKAKALVIGHDPRLTKSSTLADYAFFADYFFNPQPTKQSEKAKYKLAESVYSYILYLTNYKYTAEQLYITNLCNEPLPQVKDKTIYISEEKAKRGLEGIRNVLAQSKIEVIFAMSQQVNYWLQKLEFYDPDTLYLKKSEPKLKGVKAIIPYYEPQKPEAFRIICGKQFLADDKYPLFPILHIKNWPLIGKFIKAYEKSYLSMIDSLK